MALSGVRAWLLAAGCVSVLCAANATIADDASKTANPANGKVKAQVCATCHNFEKGAPNKIGPNLWGIVDREKASYQGFTYSPALLSFKGQKWTTEDLDKFLLNPMTYAKGTKMPFAGVKNDQDRTDIIAWLGTLSDAHAGEKK